MQMKINKHAVSKEAELETAIRDAYPKVYSYLYHRTLDAALSKDCLLYTSDAADD